MQLEKIYQSRLVVEVASIVFAVLFALWVNEWRSNIRLKTLVQEQKIRVINEIHANKAELEKVLADNQVKLDSLISFESTLKTKNKHRCHCERSLRSEAISLGHNRIRTKLENS